MILAIDVDYQGDSAHIAGVAFEHFNDTAEQKIYTSSLDGVMPYQPGRFYQRELPCIMKLFEEHQLQPDIIIIDGFVWLDGETKPGLGAHLYQALNQKTPIIGVAKNSFNKIADKFKLLRGESQKPLYITSVGFDTENAIDAIGSMTGKYRIPELLKKADSICRQHT